MIRLDNVMKEYDNFRLECSMEVLSGQVTGLIGRNGAGKSTAFKTMLGLITIDGGTVTIFGKAVKDLTAQDREKIGVVLADSGFSGYLSINDLIPVMDTLYTDFSRKKFLADCERLQLPLKKKIKDFSTGMKRKLQILAAVSHNAKLLVLDEPTAGLDVVARDELLNLLREYMETGERSIVISSHISSDLEGICDDVYMIENGKIILHEDTDVLLNEYGLLKVTVEQYDKLDHRYFIKTKKEHFGYSCLTNQRQFYQENYPSVIMERGSIDEVITMLTT
ncbi:MAG: ABC transporter ATP-binding protein [Lachnospiraceae bacterium]|nr:ABC transporter ATP-binding protein [Lachnospiraceae bacterium]HBV84802.1 ABC transporter ATP-binding protein [Lachnospiraceae bacterium]